MLCVYFPAPLFPPSRFSLSPSLLTRCTVCIAARRAQARGQLPVVVQPQLATAFLIWIGTSPLLVILMMPVFGTPGCMMPRASFGGSKVMSSGAAMSVMPGRVAGPLLEIVGPVLRPVGAAGSVFRLSGSASFEILVGPTFGVVSTGAAGVVGASGGADAHEASALVCVWPLVGVLHAAGVLRDRMLRAMSADDVHASYAPKAEGAALLHFAATRGLEAFGLFSSVASTFGNVGQANYAAANAYLDSLVSSRRHCGTLGSSLQIPAVSGSGMGATTFDEKQLDAMGAISTNEFASCLLVALTPARAAIERTLAPLARVLLASAATPGGAIGLFLAARMLVGVGLAGTSQDRNRQSARRAKVRSHAGLHQIL